MPRLKAYFEQVPSEEVRKIVEPAIQQRRNSNVDHDEFKYAWQEPLGDAILELDPEKLAEKLYKLEALIGERLQQVRKEGDHGSEQQALIDALATLRVLQRDKLNSPDWR